MTLKSEILARIDETPHRPPTHRDIIQRLYPEPYTTISAQIKALLADGLIDTETGDSGMTYTRRKASAPTPSPHAPAPMPQTAHSGLAFFPSKNANAQPVFSARNTPSQRASIQACTAPRPQSKSELAAQSKADKAATRAAEKVKAKAKEAEKSVRPRSPPNRTNYVNRALVGNHLTKPMSFGQFAEIAGIKKDVARSMLDSMSRARFIKSDQQTLPKLFFFDRPSDLEIEAFRADAKAHKMANRGINQQEIVEEYQGGAKILDIAIKWAVSKKTVGAILRSSRVAMRTHKESLQAALKGIKRVLSPEHRAKCIATLKINRESIDALKAKNTALKARITELEARLAA